MILTCTFVSAQQTIAFLKSAIEALEKDVKCVNNKGTQRQSGVFIVNFECISHLVLLFQLLTLNR